MNIVLTAVNAKYIHSNLAVYSLRAYASAYKNEISIAEKNNLIIEKQTLQAKLDNSEVINSELIAKNKTLLYKLTESENNNIAFQNEISNLRSQLNKVNSDVAIIQKSISYKLGLILTWIPRKIKEILSLAKIRRDKKL